MAAVFVPVEAADVSAVGDARRRATRIAVDAGINETDAGKAAIIAAELANNVLRHTSGGEVLIQSVPAGGGQSLEIVAIDRGPGIPDVERCLQDGYSTNGTPGTGLGAVRRLSSEFDIFSSQPAGTIVYSRLNNGGATNAGPPQFRWGAVSRPAPHEDVCGDSWSVAERPGGFAVMIADGLGHGPDAAASAREVAEVFDRDPFAPLTAMIQNSDVRLHGMRGAALAMAQIDAATQSMKYAGVGNISGHLRPILETRGRGLCSHSGTAGVQLRKVQEFDYPCPGNSLLIMHSDGLQSRWDLTPYSGLVRRHPAMTAAILYRDFVRGRDDVTVVVVNLLLD